MKVDDLYNYIHTFIVKSETFFDNINLSRTESVDGRWMDRDGLQILNPYKGIYVFSDHGENVLYVGKAHYGSIHDRVWGHLKTPSSERNNSITRDNINIYINHQWKNDNIVDLAFIDLIEKGEFKIHGFIIQPKEIVSLIEAFALMIIWKMDNNLPKLNKSF